MVCSEVSIYSSWTLIDVPTKDIVPNHTHSVQTVLTSTDQLTRRLRIPQDTREAELPLSYRASAHPNCWHEKPATERYLALVRAGKVRFGMIDRR
jgi:hypothetical protein